jgi:hypothetical protein
MLQVHKDKRGEYYAYKMDLAKAYDRVDWTNLKGALKKLGFDAKWIQWIMSCVKSVTYKVRLNANHLGRFKLTRGLTRDPLPLSPYLSASGRGVIKLIQDINDKGKLQDLKIFHQSPGFSHLLFADDGLLFFKVESGN